MEQSTTSAVPGNDPEHEVPIDPSEQPEPTAPPVDRAALSDTGQYHTGMPLRLPRLKPEFDSEAPILERVEAPKKKKKNE